MIAGVRILLDVEAASPAEVGGKGARLAALARQGLPVPRWLAVPVEVGDALVARLRPVLDEALAGLDRAPPTRAAFEAAAARIGAALRAQGLPEGVAAALDDAVRAHLGGAALLAVRSSALEEDGARDSFAGQLDSFLGVAPADVAARVVDVLASAHGARALLYRRLRGRPVAGARAAVLVQAMVEADRAGVLFTANPTSGDRDEAVIAAAPGTGEGVVAGTADAEVIHADLATGAVRARGGPGPLLSATEVAALVALGRRVAADAGTPQDLEWALDRAGALHLLQARPVTAFSAGRETVFDSANIVESYPGVTRPLTFSFVRPAYERTLREASRRFGVGEATLARERAVHANLVALVDGRIHYAILNWYRLYRQLPGFAWALPAFEKALGLPRRWVAPDPPVRGLARLSRAATVGRAWVRLAGLLHRLDADAAGFAARLEAERARLPADLDALDPHALLDALDRLSDQLTGPYAVALVSDFFTFQLHALVERLLVRFGAADAAGAPALRDALLVGIQGVESLEPLRSVADLARRAAAVPAGARAAGLTAERRRRLGRPGHGAGGGRLPRPPAGTTWRATATGRWRSSSWRPPRWPRRRAGWWRPSAWRWPPASTPTGSGPAGARPGPRPRRRWRGRWPATRCGPPSSAGPPATGGAACGGASRCGWPGPAASGWRSGSTGRWGATWPAPACSTTRPISSGSRSRRWTAPCAATP